MGNLCGILLPFESEIFLKKSISKSHPIYFRIRNMMSIEISCSTSEFSFELIAFEFLNLFAESFYKNHHFLSEISRCSCLSMGASKHRDVRICLCHGLNLSKHFLILRYYNFLKSFFECEWSGSIIDILTRESEMNELSLISKSKLCDPMFHIVFYCFYIVICLSFFRLNPLTSFSAKLLIYIA